MILIKNEHTNHSIDIEQLKKDAQTVLDTLDYSDYDLGILLTTDENMHQYNKDYRGKDKPTDILSFPFHDQLRAGERITPETADDKNIGDIILAPDYIQNDLDRWNQTFENRIKILLVHGMCHLLGYDHIEDDDYEIMRKQEAFLLDKIL